MEHENPCGGRDESVGRRRACGCAPDDILRGSICSWTGHIFRTPTKATFPIPGRAPCRIRNNILCTAALRSIEEVIAIVHDFLAKYQIRRRDKQKKPGNG